MKVTNERNISNGKLLVALVGLSLICIVVKRVLIEWRMYPKSLLDDHLPQVVV